MLNRFVCRTALRHEHDDVTQISRQHKCTRDFTNHMFSGEAAYQKGWIVVCEDAGLAPAFPPLAGFYCVRHKVREPSTELYFIGVEKTYRRSGVGERLIKDLMDRSPHRKIGLNCMKTNAEALKFYEKLGFKAVGEGINGTAWRLQKEW